MFPCPESPKSQQTSNRGRTGGFGDVFWDETRLENPPLKGAASPRLQNLRKELLKCRGFEITMPRIRTKDSTGVFRRDWTCGRLWTCGVFDSLDVFTHRFPSYCAGAENVDLEEWTKNSSSILLVWGTLGV